MPVVTVERTYLRLLAPPATPTPLAQPGEAAPSLPDGVTIVEQSPCAVDTYRALYRAVGEPYLWRDRLAWTDQELAEYLADESVRVWILRDGDGAGGYFELRRHADASIEIAYFGLMASRQGRGLGRMLLTRAIAEGWKWGAPFLWLHTCTLDGPAALPNYVARGFLPYRRDSYETFVPDP